MTANRKRLLLILLGAAILLGVAAVAAAPIVAGLDPKLKADSAILTGIPFILAFVGVVVLFIDAIILLATILNNRVPLKTFKLIEYLMIGGIVFGVVGMFQPFVMAWYTWGFVVLLLATLGYITWSHIVPYAPVDRAVHRHDSFGTVSIADVEQAEIQS